MEEETTQNLNRSMFRPRTFVFLALFLLVVGFLFLWFSRISIADNYIRTELEKLDVQASYEIADIGFGKQVVRNMVLGDPARPDLTAELVEVGNSVTGINWVRAKNVRLYGRVIDGQISFGALDKFSDPADTSPLALPAISLIVEKGQLHIDSGSGAIGMVLNGEGHLHGGFKGELAAVSETLKVAGCKINKPTYFGDVAIIDRQPRFKGALRLPDIICPGMGLSGEDLAAQVDVKVGTEFTSWDGDIGLIGGPIKYDDYSTQEIKTSFSIVGDSNKTKGDITLIASGLQSPYGGAKYGEVSGPFALDYSGEAFVAQFSGQPTITSASLSNAVLEQARELVQSTDDTPVGPLAEKLMAAVRNAGRAIDLQSDLQFETGSQGGKLEVASLTVQSKSGAEVALDGPLTMLFAENDIRMPTGAKATMRGGGLPAVNLTLNDGNMARGLSGQMQMAAYRSGTAILRLADFRFSPARGGGTKFDGRALLSGPLPDGQITGLQVPINGTLGVRGGFALFRECVNVRFASIKMASLTAGPTHSRLCPTGQSAIVSGKGSQINIAAYADALRFKGALGDSPLSLASGALTYSSKAGLLAKDVAVSLGAGEEESQITADMLSAVVGGMITGSITGAKGKIANVPLEIEQLNGDWRFEDGDFLADAGLLLRDSEQVERFRPLVSSDIALQFANGEITATGRLQEPTTGRDVATVDIVHRLDQATGQALLNVRDLKFDDQFQPELLTPLTLGIVANVNGSIAGTGQINWDSERDGIESVGQFRTDGLNLAAAFGPVTGLSGEINFSDLLALETTPNQSIAIGEVNPGIAVFNGSLRYRLLPDFKMQIDGGKWPFAGGHLYLEPTVLDLSEEAVRRFEFRVEGVDAAQFLTQFDFENLSATGVFDGVLPMIFDQDGGRISGGRLVARPGGGTLAYVGELTYEDMGAIANFAFNALKSLQYRDLTIGMNGDIAGEIITEVKFSGLQQGEDASRNFITKQLARIPIEFNVRIRAPFMQLMSSARSYYEPELLVGQNLPALVRAQEAQAAAAAAEIQKVDE